MKPVFVFGATSDDASDKGKKGAKEPLYLLRYE